MESRIQYTQTEDGASIAFGPLGEGLPLTCLSQVPAGNTTEC